MIPALIPFYYVVHSRLKSVQEMISWVIVYVVPVVLVCIRFSQGDTMLSLLVTGLALTALFSVYEAGYMANDVFTIKREEKPTLRISEKERALIEKRFVPVCCIRVLIALGSVFLAGFTAAQWEIALYPLQFSAGVLVTGLLFVFHNTRRNRWNTASYFCLSSMKYLTPLFLFLELSNALLPALLTIAIFPLVRSVEDSTKQRYGLCFMQKLVGSNDLFRVRYYGLLTILLLLIPVFPGLPAGEESRGILLFFLGLSLYYFVYRGAVLFVLKKSPGLRKRC